jgi:glucose-1-phosphate thymidylyltransferase
MKLIIPMAGRGTRLRPSTLTTPKPLLKVGGVPILKRLAAEFVRTSTISEVVFIVSPDFSPDENTAVRLMMQDLEMPCSFCEQLEAHGIAHALMCAESHLNGEILIAFGDMVIKNDIAFGLKDEGIAEAVIMVKRVPNPQHFGVVETDAQGIVKRFWEKPTEPISDMAICGVYYFNKGEVLADEIRNMILTKQRYRGEFQLTTALQNLCATGMKFHTTELVEWFDCGNKDALLEANAEVLRKGLSRIAPTARIINSSIIHPVFIGEDVVIEGSVIAAYSSIERGAKIVHSHLNSTIIGENAKIYDAQLCESVVGANATVRGRFSFLNISDYSEIEI